MGPSRKCSVRRLPMGHDCRAGKVGQHFDGRPILFRTGYRHARANVYESSSPSRTGDRRASPLFFRGILATSQRHDFGGDSSHRRDCLVRALRTPNDDRHSGRRAGEGNRDAERHSLRSVSAQRSPGPNRHIDDAPWSFIGVCVKRWTLSDARRFLGVRRAGGSLAGGPPVLRHSPSPPL